MTSVPGQAPVGSQAPVDVQALVEVQAPVDVQAPVVVRPLIEAVPGLARVRVGAAAGSDAWAAAGGAGAGSAGAGLDGAGLEGDGRAGSYAAGRWTAEAPDGTPGSGGAGVEAGSAEGAAVVAGSVAAGSVADGPVADGSVAAGSVADGYFLPDAGRRQLAARRKAERKAAQQAKMLAGKQAAATRKRLALEVRGPQPPSPRGEGRPASGRVSRRLTVPAHRGTSAVLQGAYPFQAGQGWGGAVGPYIGRDVYTGAAVTYDPWELYKAGVLTGPNIFIGGEIGSGKSSLAKTLVSRGAAFGRQAYVPGDPKGEWGPLVRALGGSEIHLGRGLPGRLNPLDAAARMPGTTLEQWEVSVASERSGTVRAMLEVTLKRPLRPIELTAVEIAVRGLARFEGNTGERATLATLVAILRDPDPGEVAENRLTSSDLERDARDVQLTVQRLLTGDLRGLFDGQTTTPLDLDAPAVSVNLSRLESEDTALPLVMTLVGAWMQAAIIDPTSTRKRYVIYDEAWRFFSEVALLRRMQAQFKTARQYGISNMVIVHRLQDIFTGGDESSEQVALAKGLLADASTRIIYRQQTDQIPDAASKLRLTGVEATLLGQLTRGQALWRVGAGAAIVAHQVGPLEAPFVDTDARMV